MLNIHARIRYKVNYCNLIKVWIWKLTARKLTDSKQQDKYTKNEAEVEFPMTTSASFFVEVKFSGAVYK